MYPYTLTQLDRWNPFSAPFTSVYQNEQQAKSAPLQESTPEPSNKRTQSPPPESREAGARSELDGVRFVHWSEEVQVQWIEGRHQQKVTAEEEEEEEEEEETEYTTCSETPPTPEDVEETKPCPHLCLHLHLHL
ncbi:myelin transcription factor 1-like [Engraulis encrasicolus]|uniref:myelin transcription factor 1-like n=1 Tax=Engraulis encrasicolus TaxID=184585 RepID=UPI002FCF6EE8